MDNVVIMILFKVPQVNFRSEIDHDFQWHLILLEEVVVLEYLECQELK